jgi:hypothetical protein
VVGLAGASAVSLVLACSSPAALLGQGGQCLQTTDCQNGLVCVPQANDGPKICSSNLATTVSTEEAGTPIVTDAAAGDAGEGGQPADGATQGDAAPEPDAGSTSTPDATEAKETEAPPTPEAAPPVDAPPDADTGE